MLLHSCDNRRCVNTSHLSVGTGADNMRDKCIRGRQERGEGHYNKRMSSLLKRGEAMKNAKLDNESVRQLRRQAAEGAKHSELATKFGVSMALVSHVIHRRAWKHVA